MTPQALDRFVSLNWEEAPPAAFIAQLERALTASDDQLDFPMLDRARLLNAAYKTADLKPDFPIAGRATVRVFESQLRTALAVRPRTIQTSAGGLTDLTLTDLAIVWCGDDAKIEQFLDFSLHTLGKRPSRLIKLLAEPRRPPWAAQGAWYAPCTSGRGRRSTSSVGVDGAATLEVANGFDELGAKLGELDSTLIYTIGLPIIPAKTLARINCPIFNLHNGALPWIRGLDSPAWSLVSGAPPAVTLHAVAPGVDTGEIVANELVGSAAEKPRKADFESAKRRLWRRTFALTKTGGVAVHGAFHRIHPSHGPDEVASGTLFYAMHPKLRSILDRMV